MKAAEQLLTDIEAFLKRHKMAAARFGIAAGLNHKFVALLRRNRECRTQSIDIARAFMASYPASKQRQKKANQASVAA